MTTKQMRWCRYIATLVVVGALTLPQLTAAHPLGNFSISHYTAIHLEADAVQLRYIIDMAEIPTFQESQAWGMVAQAGHPSLAGYLPQRLEGLRSGLILELNGQRLPLSHTDTEVIFPAGAGGLPTLKLGMRLRAVIDPATVISAQELRYRDTNFSGRAGWKEIIATAGTEVVLLHSSVPERDRSQALADYPSDLLQGPPQDVEARLLFTRSLPVPAAAMNNVSGSGTIAPLFPDQHSDEVAGSEQAWLRANRQASSPASFTELIRTPGLGLGMVLVALAVAVGLGAFHALEPGHGKTVVAAYLVGSRGTVWHALLLGLIVTATHTAGVYALGALTLFASHYIVPERLYPWLGLASGLIIAGLGVSLLRRRYAGSHHGHAHVHGPGHAHTHTHHHHDLHAHKGQHPHAHDHHPHLPHAHRHDHASSAVSRRELLALGVTGGIVPCPAALVVLLSALALNRVAFGLLLIVAFSLGLALVLIAIGVLMVYAHRVMGRWQGHGVLMTRWLPLTSAALMTVFGVVIAVQALLSANILPLSL